MGRTRRLVPAADRSGPRTAGADARGRGQVVSQPASLVTRSIRAAASRTIRRSSAVNSAARCSTTQAALGRSRTIHGVSRSPGDHSRDIRSDSMCASVIRTGRQVEGDPGSGVVIAVLRPESRWVRCETASGKRRRAGCAAVAGAPPAERRRRRVAVHRAAQRAAVCPPRAVREGRKPPGGRSAGPGLQDLVAQLSNPSAGDGAPRRSPPRRDGPGSGSSGPGVGGRSTPVRLALAAFGGSTRRAARADRTRSLTWSQLSVPQLDFKRVDREATPERHPGLRRVVRRAWCRTSACAAGCRSRRGRRRPAGPGGCPRHQRPA
jgi:hypothetical protein